jgi:hypothetical protein
MKLLIGTLLMSGLLRPDFAGAGSGHITQAELIHRTQQMYDAVPSGDQSLWKLFLADDVMYFDEKGRNMNKRAVLDDLQPMPSGYSGSITIVRPAARFLPDVVIISYDSDESETIFGQQLSARYHTTDTWAYRKSRWQIIASQTLRYYEDPASTTLPGPLLGDYVGAYELSPGNTMLVTCQGSKLFMKRGSGEPAALFAEAPDLFFRAGVEGRRFFHRNEAGQVDSMIDRRNNQDVVWKKLP